MRILTRYVLREHVGPLVFAVSALTSLLLLNYVAKRLGELVGKGLGWNVIAEFLLLSVPFTIAMTLPMAVLVATLHAFSRMAAENEITAFKASGISIRRLMVPVMVAAGVLTLGMVVFNDQVLPRANHQLQNLTNDISRKKPTFALREQVINEVVPQKYYLRAAHLVRGTNQMRDITIYDLTDPLRRRTVRADSGTLEMSADGRDLNLTLFDGSMTELSSQEPARLQRLYFDRDLFRVRGVANQLERSSQTGIKSDREMTVCELNARVKLAKQMRDSSWRDLRTYDARVAATWPLKPVPAGLGDLYCRILRFDIVRPLNAAVPVPRVAARQDPAASPAKPLSQSSDSTGRSVLAEGVRLQLLESQRVIDGNQVEIEKKFAIAFACVVFALLGAPIALRFPRGGVGMTIGVSLGVFGLYYVGLIAGEALARRSMLSPFLAMWGANLILLALGVWLTARLGSEGTTTRGSETSELVHRIRARLFAPIGRARPAA